MSKNKSKKYLNRRENKVIWKINDNKKINPLAK
jgi:hypothetical protein